MWKERRLENIANKTRNKKFIKEWELNDFKEATIQIKTWLKIVLLLYYMWRYIFSGYDHARCVLSWCVI